MAQLQGQRVSGNERICSYRYTGRVYVRVIPTSRTCPLTPHFTQ